MEILSLVSFIVIFIICRHNVKTAREHKRKAGGYITLALALWFTFGAVGAFIGILIGLDKAAVMLISTIASTLGCAISVVFTKKMCNRDPSRSHLADKFIWIGKMKAWLDTNRNPAGNPRAGKIGMLISVIAFFAVWFVISGMITSMDVDMPALSETSAAVIDGYDSTQDESELVIIGEDKLYVSYYDAIKSIKGYWYSDACSLVVQTVQGTQTYEGQPGITYKKWDNHISYFESEFNMPATPRFTVNVNVGEELLHQTLTAVASMHVIYPHGEDSGFVDVKENLTKEIKLLIISDEEHQYWQWLHKEGNIVPTKIAGVLLLLIACGLIIFSISKIIRIKKIIPIVIAVSMMGIVFSVMLSLI